MTTAEETSMREPTAEDLSALEAECSVLKLVPTEVESGEALAPGAEATARLEVLAATFSAQGGRFVTLPRNAKRSAGLVALRMDEFEVPSWYRSEIEIADAGRNERAEIKLGQGRLGRMLQGASDRGEIALFGHSLEAQSVLLPRHEYFSARTKRIGGGLIGLGLVVPSKVTRRQHLGCVVPFPSVVEWDDGEAGQRIDLPELGLTLWGETGDIRILDEAKALRTVFKAGFLAPGQPRIEALSEGDLAYELAKIGPSPRWVF